MSNSSKNILIISYVFPPYPGIGGRRWAKFAKYLHRAGHNVYVIAAQNPFEQISTFVSDIKELPKENIYYLPAKYPTILLQQLFQKPKTLWEKMQYHFWIRVLPFFTQGNYYDRSIFWRKQLHQIIRKIIEEKNIDAIIVSGPPFYLVYETVKLKEYFPAVKFIVDYRDEWTFNNVHGFGIISDKRKQVEFDKEKYVCKNADKIISPSELIIDYLINRYNLSCEKTCVVEHAYDKDDFKHFRIIEKNNNQIVISYFGTIKPNVENFFQNLNECLNKIQEKNNDVYKKIKFRFYLNNDSDLIEKFLKQHNSKIEIHYSIPSYQLFESLSKTDIILIISPDSLKNYFTSKFPEIFYLKKPILLYSGTEGLVSNFIREQGIGAYLPHHDFYNTMIDMLNEPGKYNYDSFDINKWDYKFSTDKLIEIIDEKQNINPYERKDYSKS